MSFRDRFSFLASKKVEKAEKQREESKSRTYALSGDARENIFSELSESDEKLKKYEEAYINDGIILEAINTISRAVTSKGYQIKASTPEAQENLEMWDDKIDLSSFIVSDVRDSLIYGPAFKERVYNLKNQLASLKTINPRTMKIRTDIYNNIIGFSQKKKSGWHEKWEDIDIEYITLFGLNRISGTQEYVSAVGANYDMIIRMARADRGISYYIDRHGFKKYLITCGVNGEYISPDNIKKVKAEFKNITAKNEFVVDSSIKVNNLDEGDNDIGSISDYFLTKVTAGIGIPEEHLGLGRGSTEATAKVKENISEDKISAIQRLIAKHYELEIFKPRLESFDIEGTAKIVFNDISPTDNKTKAEALSLIIGATPADPFAIITPNEARAILGLPPLEELDVSSQYHKNNPMMNGWVMKKYESALVKLFKNFKEDAIDILDRNNLSPKSIKSNSLDENNDTTIIITSYSYDFSTLSIELRLSAIDNIINAGVDVTKDHTLMAYKQGLEKAKINLKKSKIDDSGLMLPADWRAIDALQVRNLTALRGISDEVNKQIIQSITEGLKNGEDSRRIAQRLIDRIDNIGITRAELMARTETAFTHNQAAEMRYAQYGLEQVEWMTSYTDRTCDECASLDGAVFNINESWERPPLHPNCMCSIAPVVEV